MSGKRFRMTVEDRAEYGGEEWVFLDFDKLANARAVVLERYERATGVLMQNILAAYTGNGSMEASRALVWIAREQSGLRTPFSEFNIHTLKLDVEYVGDEDPEQEKATALPLSDSPPTSPASD
ncbi:hypothetical protein [Cryptosporangium sp. NPDC051539]|uniref:hypothetical protein n=1 Tax=Cryptosporangium sp. NPDC051539 TaxID=3363962 RepID=UPI0037B4EE52